MHHGSKAREQLTAAAARGLKVSSRSASANILRWQLTWCSSSTTYTKINCFLIASTGWGHGPLPRLG